MNNELLKDKLCEYNIGLQDMLDDREYPDILFSADSDVKYVFTYLSEKDKELVSEVLGNNFFHFSRIKHYRYLQNGGNTDIDNTDTVRVRSLSLYIENKPWMLSFPSTRVPTFLDVNYSADIDIVDYIYKLRALSAQTLYYYYTVIAQLSDIMHPTEAIEILSLFCKFHGDTTQYLEEGYGTSGLSKIVKRLK
jgi:hypothetical protein